MNPNLKSRVADAVTAIRSGLHVSHSVMKKILQDVHDAVADPEAMIDAAKADRDALEYVFGSMSPMAWRDIVDKKMTPPWPLEHHAKAMGLVPHKVETTPVPLDAPPPKFSPAPAGVPVDVVREYLDARACYEAATRPPNSHAGAPVLKHGDPVVLRLREARVALDNALSQQPAPSAQDGGEANVSITVHDGEWVGTYTKWCRRRQPAACTGCEGAPAPENTPCAVCGQQLTADEEAAEQFRKGWEAGHAAAKQSEKGEGTK